MHFTRRRLDRRAPRILLLAAFFSAGASAASCSSSGASDSTSLGNADAAADAASDANEAGPDASQARDAGFVDVTALPITCAAPPCATSLVTTLGAGADDRSEGFCALLTDGTVACWGANGAGQLGRGDDAGTLDSAHPARVAGLSDVVSLDHTCAIDKAGAVWCWGTGPFLRSDAGTTTTERTPVKLDLPPALAVGLGYETACAASTDGVRCWGSNSDGQLDPGVASAGTGAPKLIPLPNGAPVRALAVGRATFVLREDGTLVTWGANPPLGRLSSLFPDPHPDNVAIGGIFMVDLVHDNACATAGGAGYCWGARTYPSHAPFDIDRAIPEPIGFVREPVVQVSTTRTHVVETIGVQRYRWCATGVSGALYCWGLNNNGQAGDGTQNHVEEAIEVEALPAPVAQVKTTPNATCALLTTGKIYCWGSNFNGQLGNGLNRGRSFVPSEVVLP